MHDRAHTQLYVARICHYRRPLNALFFLAHYSSTDSILWDVVEEEQGKARRWLSHAGYVRGGISLLFLARSPHSLTTASLIG